MEIMVPYKYAIWRQANNWLYGKTGVRSLSDYKERVMYGISNEDVWSLDYYLCNVIIRGINILRKNGVGHPCYIYDENGEEIFSLSYDSETNKETSTGNGPRIWDDLLETIIAGFEAHDLLYNGYGERWSYSNVKQREHLEEVSKKGMRLMVNNFGGLWW